MKNIIQAERLAKKVFSLIGVYKNKIILKRELVDFQIFETKDHYTSCPQKDFRKIDIGDKWGGDFVYGWFKSTIVIPDYFKGKEIYLEKRSGGVEALVFADNKIIGMFDDVDNAKDSIFKEHKYIRLTDKADKNIEVCIEDYCGHTFYGTMPHEKKQTFGINGYREKCVYDGFYIVEKDNVIEEFTENLSLVLSLFESVEKDSYVYADILNLLEEISFLAEFNIDSNPKKENLIEINSRIKEFLKTVKNFGITSGADLSLIGHSHLDTAWLWTKDETKRKLAETTANAITILKRHKDYKFIMSTALYIVWLKEYYPYLYNEAIELEKQGRLEFTGGTFVECDCNLISGESLCRQFMLGQKIYMENLGHTTNCFWLPDTFGYTETIPQVCSLSNIDNFITTKLSWNDTNTFPYDTFMWKGLSDDKILAHFATIQENPDFKCVKSRSQKLKNKHLNNKALIAYGYGDGGGGPTELMVKRAEIICDSLPNVKHSTVKQFTSDVDRDKLPQYEGELYLELHRGTYTTNSTLKYLNAKQEKALRNLEMIEVFYNDKELKDISDKAYETLMINQFHDILPGTCIKEVNDSAIKEQSNNLKIIDSHIEKLCGKGNYFFNTLNFEYKGFFATSGKGYKTLSGEEKQLVYKEILPFSTEEIPVIRKKIIYNNNTIENKYYRITFNDNFNIDSFIDKRNNLELCENIINDYRIYEDNPLLWDNWDIDADYNIQEGKKLPLLSSEIIFLSEQFVVLRVKYSISEKSILSVDIICSANSEIVRFDCRLDYYENHKLLKAEFPTNIKSKISRGGIQFGCTERKTSDNTSTEQAQFEFCASRYLDLSEINRGLSIISETKYGYSCKGGKITLSLIKSGTHPDPSADNGTHYFSYSICPHIGGFNANNVVKKVYSEIFTPLNTNSNKKLPFNIISDSVIVETVKFSENKKGIVLRMYESEGTLATAKVISNYKNIIETNILEQTTNDKLIINNNEITLLFKPFEIKTIMLL